MGIHFERGQVLFEMGRYREAAKEYLAELAEEPEQTAALTSLAAALVNDGDVIAAADAIARAVASNPEFAHAHYVSAYIEWTRGKIRRAKQAIDEAIRLQPTSMYYTKLAEIHLYAGSKLEANNALSLALELDPTYVPAILLRGEMLVNAGRIEEANECYGAALQESPEEAKAQHALGVLHLAKGDAVAAIDLLTEARRIDPHGTNDRDAIAQAYGLNLPLLRVVNQFVPRWYHWSFRRQWLLCLVLTMIFSLASLEINVFKQEHAGDFFKYPKWMIFCVLLANYIILPITLTRAAKLSGYLIAKDKLNVDWWTLLSQLPGILLIFMFHFLATIAGMGSSRGPEFLAVVFAVMTCYPLIVAMARSGARQLNWYVCLPILILSTIIVPALLCAISYNHNLILYVFVALFFAITYFNERLARWASSIRIF